MTLTRFAFALGLLLSLCTLQLGLAVDDWGQILRVRGALTELGGPWDLYRFTGVDQAQMERLIFSGPYPWWTKPDIRAGFFRPLSSALIHLDVRVIGDHVVLWHLHSIAWYLLLLGLVLAFYRRVLPAAAAPVALLFFAIDDAHWMPVGWLANRNSLVSVSLALGGALLHLRWREHGFKAGAPLSALAYAAALCGGESALGVLGFVGLYELMNVRGEPVRRRALALLPLLGVFICWAVAYRSLGYGAQGSAIYIDPVHEPLEYLREAPGRILVLLGSLTLGVTSDLWIFMSKGRLLLTGLGVLGLLLFVVLVRRARPRWSPGEWRRLRWLLCSGALGLLPVIATFPADRLLLVPSIASAGLVGALLHALWSEAGALARFGRVLLVVTQGVAALPAWVVNPHFFQVGATYVENGVTQVPLSDEALSKHVVLVAAPDPLVAMYGQLARMLHGRPAPLAWHNLSFTPRDHRLTRVAEDVIELEVIDGRMIDTVMEQLFRAPRFPLDPGWSVALSGMTLTVVESNQGRPTKLRVTFQQPLSEVTFVDWRGGRLVPLTLPAVGESVLLEHEQGPMDQLRVFLGG